MRDLSKRFVGKVRGFFIHLKGLYYLRFLVAWNRSLKVRSNKTCRVIQPIYFEGDGEIELAEHVTFGFRLGGYYQRNVIEFIVRRGGKIRVGNNTHFNNNVVVSASKLIVFGKDCLVGHNCEFSDCDGHGIAPEERRTSAGISEEVVIGENVWFGHGCKILRGSRVGDNSIVAAGAVVKGKFGANCIIGGVPAKIIREI